MECMNTGDTEPATPEIVMDRMPLAPRPCAIAATMELIGDRWSMLVIRELSYGVHRFDRIAGYIGVVELGPLAPFHLVNTQVVFQRVIARRIRYVIVRLIRIKSILLTKK